MSTLQTPESAPVGRFTNPRIRTIPRARLRFGLRPGWRFRKRHRIGEYRRPPGADIRPLPARLVRLCRLRLRLHRPR